MTLTADQIMQRIRSTGLCAGLGMYPVDAPTHVSAVAIQLGKPGHLVARINGTDGAARLKASTSR
jgi:hypothetical protein